MALSLAGTLPGTTTTSCGCRCDTHGCCTSDSPGRTTSAFGPATDHHTSLTDADDARLAGVDHDAGLSDAGSSGSLNGALADLAAATMPGAPVWPAPGLGRTFTGEGLTPGQVRRLACQADLIPVVLGTGSEVLDLGRESRLASPAQLKKLWLRDRECTFPGCTVPPTWCDAHHLLWWIRGGRTDIANLALLCPRHHTIVHDKDLVATVDTTGVTWHL